MTGKEPKENPVDAIAFDWVARSDRVPLHDAERAALKAWLEQDVRHRGAFIRARALWASAERLAAFQGMSSPASLHCVPLPVTRPLAASVSRRETRLTTGRRSFVRMAMVAGMAGMAFVPGSPAEAARVYQARDGLMHLHDAQWGDILLDQGALLRVREGRGQPCLDLLEGQVHLIAGNTDMQLNMNGLSLVLPRAASLMAHAGSGESDALVMAGNIPARCAGERTGRLLHACDWIRYDHRHVSIKKVPRNDIDRLTAWSRGLLEFRSVEVVSAIAQINRYNVRKIVLKNPRLGGERISGVFSLNDPAAFARVLGEIFGTEILMSSGGITLL